MSIPPVPVWWSTLLRSLAVRGIIPVVLCGSVLCYLLVLDDVTRPLILKFSALSRGDTIACGMLVRICNAVIFVAHDPRRCSLADEKHIASSYANGDILYIPQSKLGTDIVAGFARRNQRISVCVYAWDSSGPDTVFRTRSISKEFRQACSAKG